MLAKDTKNTNVIFLCCDALRADRIYGYRRTLTPNIKDLMKDSVYFTRAFSVGPNTPNSYPSLFGRVYPSETHGLGTIPQSVKTVAEIFARNGYVTYGLNAGNAWLSEYFGYDRGFKYFRSYLDLSIHPDSKAFKSGKFTKLKEFQDKIAIILRNRQNLKRVALKAYKYYRYLFFSRSELAQEKTLRKKFLDDAKNVIKDACMHQRPFFIWFHFMSTHWPLIPFQRKISERYNIRKTNYLPTNTQELIDLYDDCVLTFDSHVGEIVNILKNNNLYDDTIIILTSDHGEKFFERDVCSHPSELEVELLSVPLIIKFDSSKISGRINELFSQIGLFESIFKYLGLRYNSRSDINYFYTTGNALAIKNNYYIFFEAKAFQDAFKEMLKRTIDVDIFGVMSTNSFLKYDKRAHDIYYEGKVEEREMMVDALLQHIRKSRAIRERNILKDKAKKIIMKYLNSNL